MAVTVVADAGSCITVHHNVNSSQQRIQNIECPEVAIFLLYSPFIAYLFLILFVIIYYTILHFEFEMYYSPNAFHNFLGDRGWTGVFSQREFIVS